MRVASFAWCARFARIGADVLLGGFTFSRPSHITVDWNAVFAAGSGRRYMRRSAALGGVGQASGSAADTSA